ncbi:MAG TPA: DUF6152 family protein [Vicinamibacterales bacterium]|nr:DUF6152 family protein [Vicinamibacterales bacterium]
MKQNMVFVAATAICMSAAVSSAFAHHSHPIFYDACKPATVEGRIDTIQFKDPHTQIVVRVDDGTAYTVEWSGLRGLTTSGLIGPAREALVPGARVVVTGHSIRSGDEIRAHFPEIKDPNPRTLDLIEIRRVGDSYSFARRPPANPPDCKSK